MGELSKPEICRLTNMTTPTISKIIDELIQIKDNNVDENDGDNELDNEKQMDTISLGLGMSLICQLLIHTNPIDQFDDLLISVIDQVPFPPESNCNDSVINSLVCMCREKEKFAT